MIKNLTLERFFQVILIYLIIQSYSAFPSPKSSIEKPIMPSSKEFKEILNNDGYAYVVKSKSTVPIDINFPNLPTWHKEEFEEWRHEILPDATVILFEYKEQNYKLLRNMGDPDCNDGAFGALFDENNDKILDLLSTGDMETTIRSEKNDDTKLDQDFATKFSPYLQYFEIVFGNYTEFEYLVFKVLFDNGYLYDIDEMDDRFYEESENDD